jgi:hypothetical protein
MVYIYAKILNGLVINMQLCQPTDYFDPAYIWVQITTQVCTDGSPIQIGCTTTDNVNFNPPTGY